MRRFTLCLCLFVISTIAAQSCKTTSNLNVRNGAGASNKLIRTLTKGAAVYVFSTSGIWAKISETANEYVSTDYLTSCQTLQTLCVNADSLNVRSGPAATNTRIRSLSKNAKVTVYSTSNGWTKIAPYSNEWCSSTYLVSCSGSSSSSSNSSSNSNSSSSTTTIPSSGRAMCVHKTVNVRSGAGTSYSKLTSFSKNKKVTVFEEKNGFSRIDVGKWVSSEYLMRTCPGDTKKITMANVSYNYKAPALGSAKKLTLYATNYYSPIAVSASKQSGYEAVRDSKGTVLAYVSHRDWCDLAMEGSGRVKVGNTIKPLAYYGPVQDGNTVNCSDRFNAVKYPSYAKCAIKFSWGTSLYGSGAFIPVTPYRAIAVDNTVIPYGSVVYVPSAVGNSIEVNGKQVKHDGYFIASDCGGAIKTTHIDVFTGDYEHAKFFPWIGSKPEKTFTAYIVKDYNIQQDLLEIAYGLRL